MAFRPGLFSFLTELRAHNDREWFEANRARYEAEVLEPALDFIEAFAPRLEALSPHFRADPRRVGGSLFRIHRDTRFSKDKSPYKTNTGMQFRHEQGRDVHAPGFYLHLEPGGVYSGGGIWHPDTAALTRIREAMVADPGRWRAATAIDGLALHGDALKRVPRGFDPDHPLADDLRRKDFFLWASFTEADATAPDFVDRYAGVCEAAMPLQRFLCEVLELRC